MIWLLLAPLIAIVYVMWLIVKACFVIFVALLQVMFPVREERTIGELDPVTEKVKWD